jgi:hypothetical protein
MRPRTSYSLFGEANEEHDRARHIEPEVHIGGEAAAGQERQSCLRGTVAKLGPPDKARQRRVGFDPTGIRSRHRKPRRARKESQWEILFFAHALVEEMLALYPRAKLGEEGLSVVIFAPSGGWWGIRAGRSGTARGGSRVLTIGGEHADFQLRAFHALDALIRKRRARGISVTVVASRLANLSRNVTSQAGRFILFSAISPQDLDAVGELIRYGSPHVADQLSALVARQAQGEAIHLTFGENYGHAQFHVRQLRSYDSHQVPPIGAAEKKPVKLATVSSKALKIAQAILFPAKPVVETSPPV